MRSIGTRVWTAVRRSGLLPPLAALGLILLVDLILVPRFFIIDIRDGHLYGSLIDMVRNSAPITILAIGMTLVIATGGIDLSVGAIMAISSSVACLMINPWVGQALNNKILDVVSNPGYSYYPLPIVIFGALLIAVLCGLWNGVLVAYGRLQPMVATLVLMIAGRGIAQLITNAVKVNLFNDTFNQIGNGWVLLLPISVYIVALMFILAWVATRRTAIGLFIESVGINFRSSYYSGINEKRIKLFAYGFCGLCAGIAGMIVATSVRTSDANQIGLYSELDAILAVVIGGTLLSGGRFTIMGSIIGGLVIQATTTSVYTIGVPASAITAVKAVVVIAVILLYSEQAKTVTRRFTSLVTSRGGAAA